MAAVNAPAEQTSTVTMPDGVELLERTWEIETPRASLVIAHGFGEHCGRYAHIAARLNEAGLSVYAYDQRGHGKSPGAMGYVPSRDTLVSDFAEYNRILAARNGAAPDFVMGHSMGALIAALYVEQEQPELRGLVLSSGAFKIGDDISPLKLKIVTLLSGILPKLPVQALDPAGLSHLPGEIEAYANDPLVYHGKIQARTAGELMTGILEVQQNAGRITCPVIFLHGTDDTLAECEGSRMMHGKVGSTDKELKIYEGAYHEVFNDTERERFMDDLTAWLQAHA